MEKQQQIPAADKKDLPIVVSVSAFIRKKSGSEKDLAARLPNSLDGLIPKNLRDATIETAIKEVLNNAAEEEKGTVQVIHEAMGIVGESHMHSKIGYYVNGICVEKSSKLSDYLERAKIEIGEGESVEAERAYIRIDRTYCM